MLKLSANVIQCILPIIGSVTGLEFNEISVNEILIFLRGLINKVSVIVVFVEQLKAVHSNFIIIIKLAEFTIYPAILYALNKVFKSMSRLNKGGKIMCIPVLFRIVLLSLIMFGGLI
jgi:hypothetical protein